jgi:hypothetical protein
MNSNVSGDTSTSHETATPTAKGCCRGRVAVPFCGGESDVFATRESREAKATRTTKASAPADYAGLACI